MSSATWPGGALCWRELVHRADGLAAGMSGWSAGELYGLRRSLAQRFAEGDASGAAAAEALAAVREAVRRVHGERSAHDCLLAGLAMAAGQVAALAGNADGYLASAVAAYLSVLRGHAVHAVSLDGERAGRWAQRLDEVLGALGVSAGRLVLPPDRDERAAAYGADIVYGSYEEFGFDYLRDNLAAAPGLCVQRGNRTAIVEDIEAVLLDRAGHRLMLKRPLAPEAEYYHKMAASARTLTAGFDFEFDDQTGEVSVDKSEFTKRTGWASDVWPARREWELGNAIRARMWYRPGTDYSVQQGRIVRVDRAESRLHGVPGYDEGILQALEAHAEVRVTAVNLPTARITVRDFFHTYAVLSGMSSTAATSTGELASAYGLKVARSDGGRNRGIVPPRLRPRSNRVPVGGAGERVPGKSQRWQADSGRQLRWLKLEAEVEGEQRQRFYAERREALRSADLREDFLGAEAMHRLERRVIVPVMDKGWSLHLAELDAIFRQTRMAPGAEFVGTYRASAQQSYETLLDYVTEHAAGYLFHLEDVT